MSDQQKQTGIWVPANKEPDIDYLNSAMISLKKHAEELQDKLSYLPTVIKGHSSDNPFNEELHAIKEEVAEKVSKGLQDIKDYLPVIQRKVASCAKNLAIIHSDKQKLRDQNAIEKYKSALRAQQMHYIKAVDQRKSLLELIKQVDKLLKQANAKKYPGKKPEKRNSHPPLPLGPVSPLAAATPFAAPLPAPIQPSFYQPSLPRREVGNLLAMGPSPGKLMP